MKPKVKIVLNSPNIAKWLASEEMFKILKPAAELVEGALDQSIADTDSAFISTEADGVFYNEGEREIFSEETESTEPRSIIKVGIKNAQGADFRAGTIQNAVSRVAKGDA